MQQRPDNLLHNITKQHQRKHQSNESSLLSEIYFMTRTPELVLHADLNENQDKTQNARELQNIVFIKTWVITLSWEPGYYNTQHSQPILLL